MNKTLKVTVAGVVTSWTFVQNSPTTNEIEIGADVDTMAANIAQAFDGSASADTVTVPLGTKIEFGTITSSQIEILNSNVPQTLKTAIALLIVGSLAEKESKSGANHNRHSKKQKANGTLSHLTFVHFSTQP